MLEDESKNDGEVLFSANFGAGLKYALYGVNLVVDYTYRGTEHSIQAIFLAYFGFTILEKERINKNF